jgi:hypothetical protein
MVTHLALADRILDPHLRTPSRSCAICAAELIGEVPEMTSEAVKVAVTAGIFALAGSFLQWGTTWVNFFLPAAASPPGAHCGIASIDGTFEGGGSDIMTFSLDLTDVVPKLSGRHKLDPAIEISESNTTVHVACEGKYFFLSRQGSMTITGVLRSRRCYHYGVVDIANKRVEGDYACEEIAERTDDDKEVRKFSWGGSITWQK